MNYSNVPSSHLSRQHAFWPHYLVKDVFPHVGVHGTEWVVQEINVSIVVAGPGQADPLLLAPA